MTSRLLAKHPLTSTPTTPSPSGNDPLRLFEDDRDEDGSIDGPAVQNSGEAASQDHVTTPADTGHTMPRGISFVAPATLRAYSRVLAGRYSLSSKVEGALEEFSTLSSLEERLMLTIAIVTESQDKTKQVGWVMTPELKSDIVDYSRAFLLSPTLSAYRGHALDGHVLDAMRELGVSGLPAKKDVAKTKKVLKDINTTLTTFRNHIKTKIKESLTDASPIRNLGELVAAIISPTEIKPTVQLYMRVAFLRACMVELDVADDQWWVNVDVELHGLRSQCKTRQELSQFFTDTYNTDIKTYGDPADTEHEVLQPRDVEDWVSSISSRSEAVKPKLPKGNKRARTEEEEEEDE